MVPEACANTQKIADQCNFDFDFGHTKIPYYKAPNGMDNQEFFEKLCWDGLERRYGSDVPQSNKDRLTYEIGVVKSMGYTNYYLIVWDYINYAKSQGIPVGRAVARARAHRGLLCRHHRHRPHPLQPHLRAIPEPRACQYARF